MQARHVRDDYVVTYGSPPVTIRVNLITHEWKGKGGSISRICLIDDNYRRHWFAPTEEVEVA